MDRAEMTADTMNSFAGVLSSFLTIMQQSPDLSDKTEKEPVASGPASRPRPPARKPVSPGPASRPRPKGYSSSRWRRITYLKNTYGISCRQIRRYVSRGLLTKVEYEKGLQVVALYKEQELQELLEINNGKFI